MCGRSRCSLSPQQVIAAARVPNDRWRDKENYRPSHNVAPGYNTPVVKRDKHQELEVHTMKWGLVPNFTKNTTEKPDHFRMFNARSETVADKTVFSRLLHRQRCVVLFDGFYEWKKEGARKQPFYVNTGEGSIMSMAGLFDVWSAGADDAPLYTYTILTTDSSKRLEWLHDRMPVILTSDEDVDAWLDTKPLSDKVFNNICSPYNGEDLVWHPVTPSMSSMSYQSPDASQDVLQKKGNISSFFKPSINALKPGAKSPVVSSCGKLAATAQTSAKVKADAAVNEQSRDKVSEARQSSGDASAGPADQQEPAVIHVMQPGRHAEQATSSEHPRTQVEDNVVDLVKNEEGKTEKTDSDILNTDDAGGIVAKPEPEPGGAALQQHQTSPPSAKRHAATADSLHKTAPAAKRAKVGKPEKGTIESFFGRKK